MRKVRYNQNIRILSPCSEASPTPKAYGSGTTITEGDDQIQVLAPSSNLFRGTHSDINNASIVLHGSQYGSDEEVLDAICPRYAVISVGENLYGHPEASALQIIEKFTSVRTFRTDVDGACVFESDGIGWRYL